MTRPIINKFITLGRDTIMNENVLRKDKQKLHLIKKLRCIMDHGGKCKHCGKDLIINHYDADFHHIDPSIKEVVGHSLMNGHYYKIKKEVDKCILLCGSCHRYEHCKWKDWINHKEELLSLAKNIHNRRTIEDTQQRIKKIKELYLSGNGIRQIAKILGIPVSSVGYTIKKLGIGRPFITKVSNEELIECFKQGMTASEVSKKYNCCYANCCRKHKKWRNKKSKLL